MNLVQQVYDSLKWKRSDEYCAKKLDLNLKTYHKIKTQILEIKNVLTEELDASMSEAISRRMLDLIDDNAIKSEYIDELEEQLVDALNQQREKVIEFKENLDNGTAEIRGIAFAEPKSPDEIVRILKIDQSKWKLSSYWNKQHRDYWLVSAMVTAKTIDEKALLEQTLKDFKPKYTPAGKPELNKSYTPGSCGVLSIQDLHFGKEGNADVAEHFKEAVRTLIVRGYAAHHLDKIVYVIGGDLLNMDTFMGQTTKGTPVDNEQRAQDAYNTAFNCLFWSIHFIAEFCKELQVVYLPGNHDRLSSYHLAHALSKCFADDRIKFDVGYAERKVVTWGKNFFGFEHGDVSKKWTPLVYATEFAGQWGQTSFRTCYTGHFHSKKTTEYVTDNEIHGFAIKHLPSLSHTDYWHYHNKFTGSKRQAVLEVHDLEKGKVSEFTYNV